MRTLMLVGFAAGCSKAVGSGDGVLDTDEVPGVGWTAELETYAHDVGGTAEIVDEDTIEIRDFTYDGGGVNARLFLLIDGEDFKEDYELTDNLVGDEYTGDTLTLDIPDGATFDDFNLITLWCVPFAAPFGDGVFTAP